MASFFTFILFLFFSSTTFASTKTNFTALKPLIRPDSLVSSNGLFELGFFSLNSTATYLGIWYTKKESDALQVIWLANRNNPLNDSSGVLRISENGTLQLVNAKNQSFWSSNPSVDANTSHLVVQLKDSGDLVLFSDESPTNFLWQSFYHPTDSMLPLMKLAIDHGVQQQQLVSWKSLGDPSVGRFTLGIAPRNLPELFVWDGDQPYWRTGPWNGNSFIGMDLNASVLLDRFTYTNDTQGKISFQLMPPAEQSNLEYYVLNFDGTVVRNDWHQDNGKWRPVWKSIISDCDVYGKCGDFGVCNARNSPKICDCLKGFVPKKQSEWSKGNWSSGCVRRKGLWCNSVHAQGKKDRFYRMKTMKVPDSAEWVPSNGQADCENQCQRLCSCMAYTYTSPGCIIWTRSLVDIQVFSSNGVDLFIRTSEKDKSSKWQIIVPVALVTAIVIVFTILYCIWRRKRQHNGNRITQAYRPSYSFAEKSVPFDCLTEFKDLPLFKLETLLVATNYFQESNKLGQGGFGPVYKGQLEDGQEIAVKRLSRASVQGLHEFMNEVLLISKLQHRNLVRLLGCCVEGEEKMLVYEYMPNKSLDAFLFDPVHKLSLDWQKRFNIIEGICRGLLYLHRDSRLKVIHRDLKASNVLLDQDLNPKISDFGMARIFESKEDQANTLRIVGTLGYMAPEYAMEGRFSEKSDVFSFGVLLLEIVSSRRVKSFENERSLTLIGYAWKLWNEDDILSLIDATISNPSFHCEIWRCIQIGLLCVQEFPEDRPTISEVISMLRCEISELPYPTQPGYVQRKISSQESSGNSQFSVNLVSLTSIDGR